MILDKSKWTPVKFGDLVTQRKDNVDAKSSGLERYIAGEHMATEDLHLRTWGEIGEDYLGPAFHRRFEPGDILYGSRRTYLKKVAVAEFEGITANTTFVLTPNKDVVDERLIPFIMLSDKFTNHSVSHSKGSVNPYINYKDIAQYDFLLPPPEQQAKFAKLLWATDEVVERYGEMELNLQKVYRLKANSIFRKKESRKRLGEVLIPKKDVRIPPHKEDRYIGLEHIESGRRKLHAWEESKDVSSNCFEFNTGNILYSKLRPYLDKAVIADFSGISTTEVLVYLTSKDAIPDYLLEILHSEDFIQYAVSKSYGTKMPRVSHEIVSNYECYMPLVNKQKVLIEQLNLFLAEKDKINKSSNITRKLQRQLINQIFG